MSAARRWWRRIVIAAAAAALAVAVLLLVVHTAPVRRIMLGELVSLLEREAGIALEAESLRYGLFARRVVITKLRLSAAGTPQAPFLQADVAEVTFPAAVWSGSLSVSTVRLDNARLSIRTRADGTSNLPRVRGEAAGEPARIPIDRLDVPNLSVEIVNEARDLLLVLSDLVVSVGRARGEVRLAGAGRARRGDVSTTIRRAAGHVTFDGRTVRLQQFELAVDEAQLVADGALHVVAADPSIDLRVHGSGDVTGLARWGTSAAVPTGALSIQASVKGALEQPAVTARVNSTTLAWPALTVRDAGCDVSLTGDRIRLSNCRAQLLDGSVAADGDLTLESERFAARIDWANIDAAALSRVAAARMSPRPAARATGSATFGGLSARITEWSIDAYTRLTAERATPGRLPVSGDVRLQALRGAWRLDATPAIDGAPVAAHVHGMLDATSLGRSSLGGVVTVPRARVGDLLGVLQALNVPSARVGAFEDGDVALSATLSGTFDRPRVDGELRLQREGSEIVASGSVWPLARTLTGRVAAAIADLALVAGDAPVRGAATLEFEGGGRFDAISGRGIATIAGARYGDLSLGRLDAKLDLDPRVARVSVISAELGARVAAQVALDASRTATIDAVLDDASLGRLTRDLEDVAVEGRVSLTAHAEGTWAAWRHATASVEVSLLEGRSGGLPFRLAAPARVAYRNREVDVSTLELQVGETRFSAAGRLPAFDAAAPIPPAEALHATVVGNLPEVIRTAAIASARPVPAVSGGGPVSLLVRATGSAEQPVLSADLEVGPGSVSIAERPPVTNLRIRARLEESVLELVTISGEWQESQLRADGRVPLRLLDEYLPATFTGAFPSAGSPRAAIRARATSLTPLVLSPFVDPDRLAQAEGSVDVSVGLEFDSLRLEDLEGEMRVERLDLRVAGMEVVQREPTRIVADQGFARVAAWDWSGPGTTLNVRGQVRLSDREAALIAAGAVDLRMLTPFLRVTGAMASGAMKTQLSVTGRLDQPRIDGVASLAGGEVRLGDPRIIVTGLDANAVLSGTRVHLARVGGVMNGGTLAGDGHIEYGGTRSARFTAAIRNAAVQFPEGLRSEVNADLTLAASKEPPPSDARGRVSGTVTVLRSSYREPIAVVTNLLAAMGDDRVASPQASAPSFADRVELDVGVVTEEDIVVENNLARLQLGADLRVIGTVARPALSGRADLREGGQLFIGRNRYTIDAGTIEFSNPLAIEPILNVQGRTRAGGEEIELTVKGTMDAPTVDVRSITTPERGKADVTSLLLTGRRLDDLSGAEAQIVGEQLVGYLSGDVLGLAGRAVGLDSVRLGGVDQSLVRRDPANVATEADPTSRLTFGKSLRDNLEITFSQSLRSSAQLWILDYQPVRRMDVRFVARDDNLRTYEFRHDLSFGARGPGQPGAAPSGSSRDAPRVASLELRGGPGDSEPRLRAALSLQPGDRFTFAEWQRDRDRLQQVLWRDGYLEARVHAARTGADTGVALSYEIEPGPRTAIVTMGYRLPRDVERALETAWAQAVSDAFLEEEAEAIVRRALAAEGYLWPEATATATRAAQKSLQITIVPGPRAAHRRIRMVADDEAISRELERTIRDAGLEDAAWQDPRTLREHLLAELRARGFLRAAVRVAPPLRDGEAAVLPIEVATGPTFTIADARVEGHEGTEPIDGVTIGDAYDPARIEAARESLTSSLRREGFIQARVVVNASVDEARHGVTVVFQVEPGPRQVLREISVAGNRSIDSDVVARALGLEVGEPLGGDEWLAARSRVFETGLFRRVDVRTEPVGDVPRENGDRDVRVVITVQEWPALRVRYGVQVAEERPEGDLNGRDLVPGLSADITRRTLFGRAVTMGGSAAVQRRDRLGRMFLNAPTMFGLPVESLLSVERGRESFADTTLLADRTGLSWEQRVRLGRSLRVSYSYGFERNHTFDPLPPSDPLLPSLDITVNVGRLTGSIVFDTRDDPTAATRGSMLSSSFDYAPAALGTDVRFVRYLGQAYRFQPWRRVVFASAARVGLAAGLGGQTVIPSERFFAGGARTVRGVREDRLGPVDVLGDPAGGTALLLLNQEVRFPIYRWVSGVGFVDAGNVFEAPSAFSLGRLVGAAGMGLRLSTPFALLRVDYARASSTGSERRPARWMFGVGHTF